MTGGKRRRGESWWPCPSICVKYPLRKQMLGSGRVSSGSWMSSPNRCMGAKRSATSVGAVRGGAGRVSSGGHAYRCSGFFPFLKLRPSCPTNSMFQEKPARGNTARGDRRREVAGRKATRAPCCNSRTSFSTKRASFHSLPSPFTAQKSQAENKHP